MFELDVSGLVSVVLIEFATILFLIYAVLRVWAKNGALQDRMDVMEKEPTELDFDSPGRIFSFSGKLFAVQCSNFSRTRMDRSGDFKTLMTVEYIELDTVTEEDLMTAGIVGQPYVKLSSEIGVDKAP
jgi:hypothetical protein